MIHYNDSTLVNLNFDDIVKFTIEGCSSIYNIKKFNEKFRLEKTAGISFTKFKIIRLNERSRLYTKDELISTLKYVYDK